MASLEVKKEGDMMKRDILWNRRIHCPLIHNKTRDTVDCTRNPCVHYEGEKYGGLYGKIRCKQIKVYRQANGGGDE